MVDRYLNCAIKGCEGVAVCDESDLRKKNLKFVCKKCGNPFTISRGNYEAGLRTFNLGPGDWLRSGMK